MSHESRGALVKSKTSYYLAIVRAAFKIYIYMDGNYAQSSLASYIWTPVFQFSNRVLLITKNSAIN